MQAKSTRMLRVKAVAAMFDVHPVTIYRAIESGKLEALRLGEGNDAIRIPEDAVEQYRESCRAEVISSASAAESNGGAQ